MFFAIVGVVILVGMLWAGVAMLFEETVPLWNRLRMLGIVVFLAVTLWFVPRLSVYRLWKKRKDMQEPIFGRITEDRVDYHGPAIHENLLPNGKAAEFIGFGVPQASRQRRQWKEYKRRRDEFSPMTEEDVKRARTAPANVGEKWDVFTSYKFSDRIVMLYRRNGLVCLFPRSVFRDDGDWNAFLHLVRDKVPS
jgi:hypothetical protein